mgnify:CR=1 FL=1
MGVDWLVLDMRGCRPRIPIANARIWSAAAQGELAILIQTQGLTTFAPCYHFRPGIDYACRLPAPITNTAGHARSAPQT